MEEIAAHLALELLQDVGSFREVELGSVARSDDLGWDLIGPVKLLVLWIQVLVAKHQEQHLWEAKLSATDVLLDVDLHLLYISLV